MLEVPTLTWLGSKGGMMQRRSVGGGWVEVNVHGASQSFLGLTQRMAEITQNGRLQVLPSAVRLSLLSLSAHVLACLHCFFSFFFLSFQYVHFTITSLIRQTLCLFPFFWLLLSCPLLYPGESLCFSSPLLLLQTGFIWLHRVWGDR